METYLSEVETAALYDALDALPFQDDDGVVRGTVADHFGPWRQS